MPSPAAIAQVQAYRRLSAEPSVTPRIAAAAPNAQIVRCASAPSATAQPEHRARRGEFAARARHHEVRAAQAEQQLRERLDHLRDRRRRHVAQPLVIPAVDRRKAAQQHRGRERQHGGQRARIADGTRIERRAEDHQPRSDRAGQQEHGRRRLLDPAHVAPAAERIVLRNHARHRHREARRGDAENHVVKAVRRAEIPHAVLRNDGRQRDLEQRADNLDEQHARRKQQRAVQKTLAHTRPGLFPNHKTNSVSAPAAAGRFTPRKKRKEYASFLPVLRPAGTACCFHFPCGGIHSSVFSSSPSAGACSGASAGCSGCAAGSSAGASSFVSFMPQWLQNVASISICLPQHGQVTLF